MHYSAHRSALKIKVASISQSGKRQRMPIQQIENFITIFQKSEEENFNQPHDKSTKLCLLRNIARSSRTPTPNESTLMGVKLFMSLARSSWYIKRFKIRTSNHSGYSDIDQILLLPAP
ncbi:hypothetical protein AVEN_92641-1 [Araneus ventricosus]|uniref:Uncharacterized protein n=1 Tax=Araneus ventricosus TaxID=182803 RepID=A0A4Y2AKI9_ARAVE|nr:hypothetical protein AVEN_92641-1 [Araneus ventricosus]